MADQNSQQDPLAALEDLIKQNTDENKAKAQQAEEEEARKAAELEAEIKAKEAAQQQIDAAEIQQQLAQLQGIGDTPQNQARVQQRQDEQEQKQVELENLQGHEIRQVEHTTIEADSTDPNNQGN